MLILRLPDVTCDLTPPPTAGLVPLVLRHRLQGRPTWEFTRRILMDEHFEFRGGRPRDASWGGVLTRVEDG